MSTRTVLTKGSRNVFTDLGFPESEAQNLALRSDLMIRIEQLVQDSGMTQQQAAKTLGVTQPRLNALLKGKIAEFRGDLSLMPAFRQSPHRLLEAAFFKVRSITFPNCRASGS